jgi:creatinine amidohydrolase
MEKVRYEEMLPHEVVERREKCPVAYLPLGGLEWHGEHLALGNDALKAHALCILAAQRSGGIAFPPLWYGEPRDHTLLESDHDKDGRVKRAMRLKAANFSEGNLGNTFEEQVETYTRLVEYAYHQIRSLGFKAICVLTGHYPLYKWAGTAARRFNRKHADTKVYVGIEFHYVPSALRKKFAGGDHAAKWETSYLMALRPECVDMSVFLGRDRETLIGVYGEDPRRTASREVGERGAALIVQGMNRKAKHLLASVAKAEKKRR